MDKIEFLFQIKVYHFFFFFGKNNQIYHKSSYLSEEHCLHKTCNDTSNLEILCNMSDGNVGCKKKKMSYCIR